jgi:3-keto-5-aminohexanoate cleavage enzyme
MEEEDVKPEMEIYNYAMFREVSNLIRKNLVKKPYLFNLVLGMKYQGAIEATPKHLVSLLENVPKDAFVNVTAVGFAQLPLTTMGMILTGCIRVGLEDNIYYRRGDLAKSNAQLVARAVRIARELNKEPMSPEEARKILGLTNRKELMIK